MALIVAEDLIAWHAGEHNSTHVGIEVAKPGPLDPIPEPSFKTLVWRIKDYAARYGFDRRDPRCSSFHCETPQGIRVGKVDLYPRGSREGAAFRAKLMEALA